MKKNKYTNASERDQNIYSDKSAAQRNMEVGLCPTPIGLVNNSVTRIAREAQSSFVTVVFYNNTAAVVFVAFGDATVAAPADATTGYPILPGEKCILNSGANTHVISSLLAGIPAYVHSEIDA